MKDNRQITETQRQEHCILVTYMDPRFKIPRLLSCLGERKTTGNRQLLELAGYIQEGPDPKAKCYGTNWTESQQHEARSSRGERSLWNSLENFGLDSSVPTARIQLRLATQRINRYLQDTITASANTESLLNWQFQEHLWSVLFHIAGHHLNCPIHSSSVHAAFFHSQCYTFTNR